MTNSPFNGSLYIERQTQAILDRLQSCSGPLYLEVGGHFLVDNHASRVLPGYIPDSKAQIFRKLAEHADLSVIFCINAKDIVRDRQFGQKYMSFEKHLSKELQQCEEVLGIKPIVCITMLDHDFIPPHIRELESKLHEQGYHTYHKYLIDGYPTNTNLILSANGYGKDDYINSPKEESTPLRGGTGGKHITLVSACGSNSGKFNTCLSQLYLDHQANINSHYAKFETFPIRNLPLEHPINLAYEAATADIGDYNMVDPYYTSGTSINYNRDVEAFEILKSFFNQPQFAIRNPQSYNSPTEMGINTAGFCLSDDEISKKIIADACHAEIQSRLQTYERLLASGHGEEEAIERCKKLLQKF